MQLFKENEKVKNLSKIQVKRGGGDWKINLNLNLTEAASGLVSGDKT